MAAEGPSCDLILSDDRSESDRPGSLADALRAAGSGVAIFMATLVVAFWIVALTVVTWSSIEAGGSWGATGLLWAFFGLGIGLYRTLLPLAQRSA